MSKITPILFVAISISFIIMLTPSKASLIKSCEHERNIEIVQKADKRDSRLNTILYNGKNSKTENEFRKINLDAYLNDYNAFADRCESVLNEINN